jgi:glycosyltransferase involved in cell wall biosynthesis
MPASSSPRLRLTIEGWRFIPHSYAIVNQFQCLELLRRPDIEIRHRDMPYFLPQWTKVSGLLDPASEAALRDIPAPIDGQKPDACLRIDYPHRLESIPGVRTAVFMTAEFGCVPTPNISGARPLAQWQRETDVLLITPSQWSRQGILRSGIDPARVLVVPHGIDPGLFYPLGPDERQTLRRKMQVDEFHFLHLGAMTGNKNIPLLLKAFAAVVRRHPRAKLVLKGLDALYNSRGIIAQSGAEGLTSEEVNLVKPRIAYLGNTLSFIQLRELYQALDAYVAPYSAEGFNLPALEAAASGMPLICTAGGATDDFTTPDFALPVEAGRVEVNINGVPGCQLAPSLDSLIAQMTAAIEHPEFAARARIAGPRFVANGFLWSQAVDRLIEVLAPPRHDG